MNKVIKSLVLSDLFILGGFGLIQPVFAVFLIRGISGATIAAVGIAATIQLFVKAVFQIWVAQWADREKGNCRELYTLIVGSFLVSAVPFGYAYASSLAHIYIAQCVYGLGQALAYPSWRVLFSRYTDHDHAGLQWGIYDTVASFGAAAAAAIGGLLAETITFHWLFIVVGVLSFLGSLFLINIFNQEFSCRIHFKRLTYLRK